MPVRVSWRSARSNTLPARGREVAPTRTVDTTPVKTNTTAAAGITPPPPPRALVDVDDHTFLRIMPPASTSAA